MCGFVYTIRGKNLNSLGLGHISILGQVTLNKKYMFRFLSMQQSRHFQCFPAKFRYKKVSLHSQTSGCNIFCGSPPGVIVADTLSFNAKIGLVDF